jgi:hypothetical protein
MNVSVYTCGCREGTDGGAGFVGHEADAPDELLELALLVDRALLVRHREVLGVLSKHQRSCGRCGSRAKVVNGKGNELNEATVGTCCKHSASTKFPYLQLAKQTEVGEYSMNQNKHKVRITASISVSNHCKMASPRTLCTSKLRLPTWRLPSQFPRTGWGQRHPRPRAQLPQPARP